MAHMTFSFKLLLPDVTDSQMFLFFSITSNTFFSPAILNPKAEDGLRHRHQPDVRHGLPVQHLRSAAGDRVLHQVQARAEGQRSLPVQLLVLSPSVGPGQLPAALSPHAGA